MISSKHQRPPDLKDWTKDDVREWLISDVNVSPIYAELFFNEDVSGEYLLDFSKSEILDLNIKHGPAVKITFHLKQWKEESKTTASYPVYVHSWSKEQVNQWLLQCVKLYEKSALRLLEEEVSGDCLVCFQKQDFKDLDIKQGPAVKILAELGRLKDKPEPVLQPVTHASVDEESKETCVQAEARASQPVVQALTQEKAQVGNMTYTEIQSPHVKHFQNSTKIPLASLISKQRTAEVAPIVKTTAEASRTVCFQDIIYNALDNLLTEDLKQFCFHLESYTSSKYKQISRRKLESTSRTEIASLICENYVKDAPLVTVDILQKMNKNVFASELEKAAGLQLTEDLQSNTTLTAEADQGEKLKSLLTGGGNTLDNYKKFVVVLNKSDPDQVQHLNFLSKLKLFCVLDFDPNSVCPGGLCHSYRKERIANLHKPSQYQGKTEEVIKNLNLHKQTSWVFCNGRNDLESTPNQELDFKCWLKTSCRDVEQLLSFICKPEVLYHGEFLVIFILLSPVETEKNPMFETYRCFYKNTSEKNIVTLCESKSTYSKWKKMIHEKCDTDIDPFSINELSLSQINGTITALGPLTQSNVKLLASSDSSVIVLKQKDEDLMTDLEVLCVNQCENIHDESSKLFRQFKLKQEEEFYRGGKVRWWNFYFCEKDKERPFIKRDKYENMKKLIRTQLKYPQNSCVVLSLYHQPGCGATTLVMHLMWDLRKDLRCAVLKDNNVSKEDVSRQVIKLMKLENEKPCTVLLFVDDSKETDIYELVNFIHKTLVNTNMENTHPCKVIVLNCVRCHSPKEQYREHNFTHCQYLTASLTQQEQQDFEKKLKELEETHNKPENFYSFMLMKSNFDPNYTRDLASHTLESFDMSMKNARLFAFLALLNTYVADSEISLSLCEDFLGIKFTLRQEDSVLNRMAPYSNLLIIERVEDWGGYKGVRILHNQIAEACLEELADRYQLKVSDITTEILNCDLFYSSGVVKNRLMFFIQQMLIKRLYKEDGEKEPFSRLIKQIHTKQGRRTVQEIFAKASSRFEASSSIPQALARYLYIKERDFSEALNWAEKAKKITKNSYTLDTIAQVHKSHLKQNMEREKQEKSCNPEDLDENLKIAVQAIEAFQEAQELAATLNEAAEESEDDEDDPRKSYNIYGYVGIVEIAFLVFEVLGRLPFFDESQDPMCKMYLKSFLERNIPITSVHKKDNELNQRLVDVIRERERFLLNLKDKVKETFEILQDFLTYFKVDYSVSDSRNRRIVSANFKKYVTLFCTEPEEAKKERLSNPQLALEIMIEQKRQFLEEKNADTFSGILQNLLRSSREMEEITQAYAYLHKNKQFISKMQATKVTTNYILSNIVLYLSNPKSKHVQSYSNLSDLLHKHLQEVGLHYKFPDPYYTALLLLWPGPSDKTTDIQKYVNAIRKSSRNYLSTNFRSKSTVAHLFLTKRSGLQRLVSKLQLDKNFTELSRRDLAQLWRSGDIFKEKCIKDQLLRVKGTIEEGEVYAEYGSQKVPVRPALIPGTRSGFSTEKVSFFLGFAINGPLAYNIKNEN